MNTENGKKRTKNQCRPELRKGRTGNYTAKQDIEYQTAKNVPLKTNVQNTLLNDIKYNHKLKRTGISQDFGEQLTTKRPTSADNAKQKNGNRNAVVAPNSSIDLEGVVTVCPVRKKKKRNQSQHNFANDGQSPVLSGNDVQRIIKKKRRRKKILKNRPAEMDANGILTNGNYPKEFSSKAGLSCNWKNLCQTLSINKPTSSTNGKDQTATASYLARNKKQHVSKTTSTEIWFDGVDKDLLEPSSQVTKLKNDKRLVKDGSFKGLTNAVAMDCEMVGIGENGADSLLARVSIVNLMGNCIYDKYVKPTEPVIDYRTPVSGIRPSDLEKGEDFKVVQKEVSDILDKRILVGHAVHNDLKVLFLTHPRKKIRDTSIYKYFKNMNNGNTPSLKWLSNKLLGVKVQEGEHSSVQDAQATMRLYTMHKIDWEKDIKKRSERRKADVKVKTVTPVKTLTHSPTARKFSKLKL